MLALQRLRLFPQSLQLGLLHLRLRVEGQLGVGHPAASALVLLEERGGQRRLLLVRWVMHEAGVHRPLRRWLRRRIALPCALQLQLALPPVYLVHHRLRKLLLRGL